MGKVGDSRGIGIIDARGGDWSCVEREGVQDTRGNILQRELIGYSEPCYPLYQKGDSIFCLMRRVFVRKLLIDFRRTSIQYLEMFSGFLSYPFYFSFSLGLAGLCQCIPINAPRYAHNHVLV